MKVPSGKILYLIGIKDDSPFVSAALWEGMKDPENGEWLHTCTIITGDPKQQNDARSLGGKYFSEAREYLPKGQCPLPD